MELRYKNFRLGGSSGSAGGDSTPIGTIISFLGMTAPEGYLVCNGQIHSISSYPALAAFFKEQFGASNHFGGDGVESFAVPDLQNLFLRGYYGDSEERLSGEIGKRQEATSYPGWYMQEAIRGSFNVIANWDPDQQDTSKTYAMYPQNADTEKWLSKFRQGFTPDSPKPITYQDLGFDQLAGFTTRPVNAAVLYCIKA